MCIHVLQVKKTIEKNYAIKSFPKKRRKKLQYNGFFKKGKTWINNFHSIVYPYSSS